MKTRKYHTKTGLLASALCLLAGGLILLSPSDARAQTSGKLLNVSGDWSASGTWENGTICDGAGSVCSGVAVSKDTTRTITLDSSRTIGAFSCEQNGTTRIRLFQGLMGTETITLSAGTIVAYNGPLVFKVPLIAPGGMYLRPWGGGAVVLDATNSWPGDTTITQGNTFGQGSIRAGSPGAIPHGAGAGNVIFDNSGDDYGTLNLLTNDITINGLSGEGGRITTTDGTAGTTTLTVGDNNAGGSFAGVIDDNATHAVALTKIGTGTLQLGGACTYFGDTTVNGGALFINGSIGGGSPASTVYVNGGAIGGTGTIYGPVYVYATGGISPGASAGTLTLYGGLDMSAPNTTYNWELAANSTTPGDFDVIALPVGSADVTDANLNIQFTGSATAPDGTGIWATDQSWLIVAGSVTGNFKNIQNGTNAFGSFYTTVDGSGVTLHFKPGNIILPAQKPKITSVSKVGTTATVNYTDCVVGKTYYMRYQTAVNGAWTTNNPAGKVAAGTSDFQTDSTASGSPRWYQVWYVAP